MLLGLLILVAACASSVVSEQAVDIPAGIKTCRKNSDDFSSCFRLALQEAWPIIVQGIPELSVPPSDPFYVDSITNNFELGPVNGEIIVSNSNTYGSSKIRFLSVRALTKNGRHRMEIDVELPKLFIDGEFKANGAIGTFKVGGKGHFNISMENVRGIVEIDGKVKNDRWVIDTYNFKPTIGEMKIWADDLFNGNPELTKIALEFANENWRVLYSGMLPYAAKTWNALMVECLNKIFSKISYASVFP